MRLDLGDDPDDGPNLTPLIDVVFLLLVFFLAATTFAKDEVTMDLDLPKSQSGKPKEAAPPLVVVIRKDGALSVDGRVVDEDGLRQRLSAAAARSKDQEVLVRGDVRVHFGAVASVLDACRIAALTKVAIAAAPSDGSPR